MSSLLQDLRRGTRLAASRPGCTAIAVIALALGIGPNTAIFSVVNSLLLQPPPYPDADRIVATPQVTQGQANAARPSLPSSDDFQDWRRETRTMSSMAVYAPDSSTLTGFGDPVRLDGARVSPAIFSVLGVNPMHGRTFTESDEAPGAAPAVIVSEKLWDQRLGRDPSIVGKPIALDGGGRQVIGVMPATFGFPTRETECWAPYPLTPPERTANRRRVAIAPVVARLKPGVSIEQASAEGNTILTRNSTVAAGGPAGAGGRAGGSMAPEQLAWILSAAARRGHVRLFEYYRERGGEALFADESTRRAIMRSAITGGSLEMVKKLQARGMPLDVSANQNGASPEPQKFPRLTGPYLGQTPPGDELKVFAPGIVYLDHGTVSVSPDGQEMYWPTGKAIMMTRILDGRWTQPAFAPFSGPSDIDFYDDVPFVTPDNRRLFFTSKRPLGSETSQKENIWFVERTATGWSQPRPVGPAVNAMSLHWQVAVANSGTLYFGGRDEKNGLGSADIYASRLVNGEYTTPVNLGPAVNSKDGESQPFVAPDESFILFYRAPGQIPTAYVSFRGRDGQWLPAVTFDMPWAGAGLIVSPDGKYLFAGGRWQSTGFLDELRRRAEGDAK